MADLHKKKIVGKKTLGSAPAGKPSLGGLGGPFAARSEAEPAAPAARGASRIGRAPTAQPPKAAGTAGARHGTGSSSSSTRTHAGSGVSSRSTVRPGSRIGPPPSEPASAPKRKGASAPRSVDTNSEDSRANRTSIRQSATQSHSVSQTGTNLSAGTASRRGSTRAKYSLALKFAVPVAVVVILVFFATAVFVSQRVNRMISQEIIRNGVAQVSMLANIGKSIIDNSNDSDWPVKLGFITEENVERLWEQTGEGAPTSEEARFRRTLCAARNGELLQRYFVSLLPDNKSVPTQTVVAYILSEKNTKLYKQKTKQFILAASLKPSEKLRKEFDSEAAAVPIITTDNWLPNGIKLNLYHVGGNEYQLGEGTFCDVYSGNVELDGRSIKVLGFQMPILHDPTSSKMIRDGIALIGIDAEGVISSLSAVGRYLLILGVCAIFFTVFTCLFIGFQVVKPVEVLISDMEVVGSGNISHKSHVATNDEIGLLASQFNAMTAKLQGAVQTEKKIAAVESELDMAREIQKKLLPEKLPQIKGLDIFATYHPAKEVGGDYYDFFPIDESHVGIMVADVSGKGVPGSMVMATTRTILRFVAGGNLSSADTLKRTNSMVAADIKRGMFVTAFYIVLDVAGRSILCSSAGHNPMVHIHADGNYDLINPNGIALGFDKGRIFDRTIKEQPIPLQSGDRIVLYTDGVVEAMNLNNEEYTDERFYSFIQNHFKHDSETFVNELLEDLNRHKCSADTRGKKAEQHDDITIVTFRVL